MSNEEIACGPSLLGNCIESPESSGLDEWQQPGIFEGRDSVTYAGKVVVVGRKRQEGVHAAVADQQDEIPAFVQRADQISASPAKEDHFTACLPQVWKRMPDVALISFFSGYRTRRGEMWRGGIIRYFAKTQEIQHDDATLELAGHKSSASFLGWFQVARPFQVFHSATPFVFTFGQGRT